MTKNKSPLLAVRVPISSSEKKGVELIAKRTGTTVAAVIRQLLVDRLKAYKISRSVGDAAIRPRVPSRVGRGRKTTNSSPANSSTKPPLPDRLVTTGRNAAHGAGAGSKGSPVQHSLPMNG